jgi:hypothetical protein
MQNFVVLSMLPASLTASVKRISVGAQIGDHAAQLRDQGVGRSGPPPLALIAPESRGDWDVWHWADS